MQQSAKNFIFFKVSHVNLQHTSLLLPIICSLYPVSSSSFSEDCCLLRQIAPHVWRKWNQRENQKRKTWSAAIYLQYRVELCCNGKFLVSILASSTLVSSPLFLWDWETVARRLWCWAFGRWGQSSHLPPLLLIMYDFQHITPPLTHTHKLRPSLSA